ncbi:MULTISPECIES: hypothetical protein [Sinorhizobium]|uniref:hypothetical protein n=1 Tax=Sinorhizobium TaxID=28105 RepID=UPI001304B421|nr:MULTISPECIES: hypothetical protein [Sinorhizobium]
MPVREIDEVSYELEETASWQDFERFAMCERVSTLGEGWTDFARQLTYDSSAAARHQRDLGVRQTTRGDPMFEERREGSFPLRDVPTVSIHQCQLQGDQGGEFARFHHTEIRLAQQVERLRTLEFRANDIRNPRVDAEPIAEVPPISGLLELEKTSRIARRRPGD